MKALDRLGSLKLKLGLMIVLAIAVTLVTLVAAVLLGVGLAWGALAAVALSLGSVHLVARGLTAPLRAMAAAAEAMACGEHGQRVAATSRDEVGQLAAAFNRMAVELELLDRVRRDLVADAAHELRTPISALRATLENAVDGVGEVDPRMLLEQVERLGRLTDQLLDLSRLEAGSEALERRSLLVCELLEGRGVTVEAPGDLRVVGDRDRLDQVVTNLVANARRHAPGAPVVLRGHAAADGGVRLEVEDHGPGLQPGDRERIFDRFARADRSRSTTGAGLGLAIARSIVELHGGAIRAEPATPHGCRMVVELP